MSNSPLHALGTPKIAITIVTIAWLLMQLIAWLSFGIKTSVDTPLYTGDAMAIVNGNFSAIESPFYLSYSFLLACVIILTGNFTNVVIVQLVLSLLAVLLLYRLTFAISENRFTAFIAAMIFAVWPDVSQWNFFVYTDAAFMNLVVISIALLHFSKRPWQYALAAMLIIFTIFTRLAGVVFFLSLLFYFSDRIKTTVSVKYTLSAFVVLGLVIVNYVLQDSIDSFFSSYMTAEIIYPDVNLFVQAPADLSIPASHHQPIIRLLLFVLNNPVYFIKLFFIKVALFVGHMKPYFSVAHNILIGVFLYPLYLLAVAGVRSLPRTGLRSFAISFILLQVVMVGLTSENWDGRFLLPVLPWIFILSSAGITKILNNRTSWALN